MFGCCPFFCRGSSVNSSLSRPEPVSSGPEPVTFSCEPCYVFFILLSHVVISDDYQAIPYFVYWLTAISDGRGGRLTGRTRVAHWGARSRDAFTGEWCRPASFASCRIYASPVQAPRTVGKGRCISRRETDANVQADCRVDRWV